MSEGSSNDEVKENRDPIHSRTTESFESKLTKNATFSSPQQLASMEGSSSDAFAIVGNGGTTAQKPPPLLFSTFTNLHSAPEPILQSMFPFPLSMNFGIGPPPNPPAVTSPFQPSLLQYSNFLQSLISAQLTPAPAEKPKTQRLPSAEVSGPKKAAKNAPSKISDEEQRRELAELKAFVEVFREKRVDFKHTQFDVETALKTKDGKKVLGRKAISRFENGNASLKAMRDMRPVLERWIAQMEKASGGGGDTAATTTTAALKASNPRGRKVITRMWLTPKQSNSLRELFKSTVTPKAAQFKELAERLGLEEKKIRKWFANERLKDKVASKSVGGEVSRRREEAEEGTSQQ